MNIKLFSKAENGNEKLSENFRVSEFACKDGTDKIYIDVDMIPILQTIRDVGGRVTINSAYRTVTHNQKVGGASKSYHLSGQAFDITSENLTPNEICEIANTLGVNGIIRYPDFVHLDSRKTMYHADNKGNYLKFAKAEQSALDYLVKKGRVKDRPYWEAKLCGVKWLLIKWATDLKRLDKQK